MDYLQYSLFQSSITLPAFVLNLVINGLPSILKSGNIGNNWDILSFKPCYKWITFNTLMKGLMYTIFLVLAF